MDDLTKHQQSINRIFDIIDLFPMTEEESREFFNKMFGSKNISVDPASLSLMYRCSGGFPMLMHEVGDAIFWSDNDNVIDQNDIMDGVKEATKIVGRKYLSPQINRALKGQSYRYFLKTISKSELGEKFQRQDILSNISKSKQKNVDTFLRRMKELGVIKDTTVRGEYKFVNLLYYLYIISFFEKEKALT